jgi:DNA gyrase inhibitor GyrI
MTELAGMALLTASDADIRQQFEGFIKTEKQNGLVDVKFAIAQSPESTVIDAMRQMMMISGMSLAGQLKPYND